MPSLLLLLTWAVLWPLAGLQAQPAPTRADTGPHVVAPGVLSEGQVFRGSFTPDGRTLYFFKKVGEGERYRIVASTRSEGGWTIPKIVDLGGDFSDLYPSITGDGRRMVFSSYRPVPGATSPTPNAHLWYSVLVNGRWGTPVFMGRASTLGHYHSWVHAAGDGSVYFRRTTPDWTITETRLTRWTGTEYAESEAYADADRWKGWRPDVDVVGGLPGPDGRSVFLDVATRNPRTGGQASDIWVSLDREGEWTEPTPLGAGVNGDGFDVFPFFSPDGKDLYFVRDFTTFYRIGLDEALASAENAVRVRYVANSGMLIQAAGRRFLIDAPIREGITPYATSPADERRRLESAEAPYDAVDAILVTHWHEDHFSAEAVAAHLERSPRTVFVSSPEVVERLRLAAPGLPASRVRAVLPPPGTSKAIDVAGVTVHVLRLRHNPSQRYPEQHVGFLIGGANPVLHAGDADPVAGNFQWLGALPRVDLALLPFWYVTDEATRAMVGIVIRPRRVVAMHAPPEDTTTIAQGLDGSGFRVVLADRPGSVVRLPR